MARPSDPAGSRRPPNPAPVDGPDAGDTRSIGELVAEMSKDLGLLVRKELELAKIEIKEEVGKAGKAAGALGGGAFTGYMTALFLSLALAWGLTEIMPEGFAFLVVAVLYGIATAVLLPKGRRELQHVNPVPEQTVDTLKEDAQWAKAQMR